MRWQLPGGSRSSIAPALIGLGGLGVLAAVAGVRAGDPLGTSSADFFQRGTQPDDGSGQFDGMQPVFNCFFCHAEYDVNAEPYRPWAASMMGQSARDPMFWACLAIANQDAAGAGEFCIRCHVPNAYLAGRSTPADGSAFLPIDFEGVNCNFCHRLVDPTLPVPPGGPAPDAAILADLEALDLIPPQGSNARFIVDPTDSRRGPFDDLPSNPHLPVEVYPSPFHTSSELCWTCHDVSNPLLVRQPDGRFVLDDLDAPHPTGEQEQMLPLHRTYSEWKNSYYFTTDGVQHDGRFGGNHPTGVMRLCQDCHMPDQEGFGCGLPGFPLRPDVPQHSFIGSNTWGLKAVRAVDFNQDGQPDFDDGDTGLSDATVEAMIARNVDMLEKATDLQLSIVGEQLKVRIINQSGHKVPSGFPDGRRMWVNVKYFDAQDSLAFEAGEFDFSTGGIVNPDDTRIYEVRLGVDGEHAAEVGLPEGETFHFVLANVILKDNRIPPTGFSNNLAVLGGHEPIGATYADGQHWDDTYFDVPGCATRAVVTVYYQLVSDEYATFLRDTNVTNQHGEILFDLWADPEVGNRSAPVAMDMSEITLPVSPADVDGDGAVSTVDLLALLAAWGPCGEGECPADLDCDGLVGVNDFLIVLGLWPGP